MPYTQEKALKNDFYQNVSDADEQKQLKAIQEALARMQISGSTADSTNPLRDENNVLLSYEDPNEPGESIEQPYQYVRLNIRQKSTQVDDFVKYLAEASTFKEIFPEPAEVSGDAEDAEDLEAMKETLAKEIDRNEELNSALEDSIQSLQESIAQVQNQTPPPPPEKKKKDSTAKKVLKKVADVVTGGPVRRTVKKAVKKVGKALKKIFSDERLKRDIVPLGMENGFNTYGFRYIWGTQRYKGVMAQEVMKTNPQSVDKLFGLYRVDYEEIGVEFTKC